jgi:hypothetical protein
VHDRCGLTEKEALKEFAKERGEDDPAAAKCPDPDCGHKFGQHHETDGDASPGAFQQLPRRRE